MERITVEDMKQLRPTLEKLWNNSNEILQDETGLSNFTITKHLEIRETISNLMLLFPEINN